MTMMLKLVAVAVTMAVVSAKISLEECPRDVCNCLEPNVSPGDLSTVQNGNSTCACSCGRKINAACDNDGHCSKGGYCGAPKDITQMVNRKMGVCTDKCKKKVCPAFNKCILNDNGDAECECQTYNCETGDDKTPTYRAKQNNRIMTFNNMCMTVNLNCQLTKTNPETEPWKFLADQTQ